MAKIDCGFGLFVLFSLTFIYINDHQAALSEPHLNIEILIVIQVYDGIFYTY